MFAMQAKWVQCSVQISSRYLWCSQIYLQCMSSLSASPSELNPASSTEQYTWGSGGFLLSNSFSHQHQVAVLLPCCVLHDKCKASSSLVQHPLWLCIILYYRLKALSHPHRERKGRWTFLANENLRLSHMQSCNSSSWTGPFSLTHTHPTSSKPHDPCQPPPLFLWI